MNFDISMNKKTPSAASYIEHLISCGSIPIIPFPTRVTEVSSTIIDRIVTNDTSQAIKPRVIRCNNNLSDHNVIFCDAIGYTAPPNKKIHKFTVRDT